MKRATSDSFPLVNKSNSISIHTLCEEGDYIVFTRLSGHVKFQSTPSVKRATGAEKNYKKVSPISIHTLCEEGDESVDKILEFKEISIHTLCEVDWNLFKF